LSYDHAFASAYFSTKRLRPDQKVIEAHASDLGPQIVGKSLAYFIERRKAVRILNRTVWSFISTIIRRESHWQSRVLRNDLH